MARQGMMLLNDLRELPPDGAAGAAAVHAGRRGDRQLRRLVLLDAGRVLMLWGWGTLATAAVSSTGKRRQPDAGDAAHAFLGFLLWLVGVSLVTTFTPTARRRRFPRVARHGAAVASLVMGCFFPPWN